MNLLKSLFNCQFLLGTNQDAYSFGLATLPFPSVCFHGSSYATVILSLVCVSIPPYTHAASSCFLNEIVFFFFFECKVLFSPFLSNKIQEVLPSSLWLLSPRLNATIFFLCNSNQMLFFKSQWLWSCAGATCVKVCFLSWHL